MAIYFRLFKTLQEMGIMAGAMGVLLVLLIVVSSTSAVDPDEVLMDQHMYQIFKEESKPGSRQRQFAVLSVDPEKIACNAEKQNVNVTYYAHRYPNKVFNGKNYSYYRHAESWCFDEINTMWNWYLNAYSQPAPKVYLYTLNSPCHEFCTNNTINMRNQAPQSSAQWYLGYTKLWRSTTMEDLKRLKDANIVVYKIEDIINRRKRNANTCTPNPTNPVRFDIEVMSCMQEFHSDVCQSVNPDIIETFVKTVIEKCGKSDAECWSSHTVPINVAGNCNYTMTETNDVGNSTTTVTVTAEDRLELCRLTSLDLELASSGYNQRYSYGPILLFTIMSCLFVI